MSNDRFDTGALSLLLCSPLKSKSRRLFHNTFAVSLFDCNQVAAILEYFFTVATAHIDDTSVREMWLLLTSGC